MDRDTAEVEITWNKEKVKVVVQQLLDGEYQDIQKESITTRFVGSQPKITFDPQRQRVLTIIKGVKEAPFKMDLNAQRQLKIPDAEKLLKKIQEVSGLPLESEKSLSEPSSQKEADTK